MNRRVLVLALALLLLGVPAASAQPDDPVDDLLGKKDPEPTRAGTPLESAKDDVVPGEPEAPDVGFLSGLLNGAAGLVSDVGSAIADGVAGVGLALGDFLATVFIGVWDGATWAIGTAFDGTVTAVFWSVTGVWGLMTGTILGTVRIIGTITGGVWSGIEGIAFGIASLRPVGVSEGAWAGSVAVAATGASAAANFGLLEALRRFGWTAGAGVPLFSRIAKDDILEHPLRAEIFETIKTNPGIHISALSRQVDAGWGTTIHHLRKLQEKELVAVRMVNNQKCFFHNGGSAGRSTWTQLPELKNETASRIAHFILANPLSPVTSISEQLAISPSLVSHHVRKLEKAGVVEKHRDGRFVKLAVTEQARGAIFGEAAAVPAVDLPVAA